MRTSRNARTWRAETEAKELGAIARTGIQRPRKCALDIFIAKDLDSGTVLHVLSVLAVCSLVLVVYSEWSAGVPSPSRAIGDRQDHPEAHLLPLVGAAVNLLMQ
jgi:hypothetical protein